MFDWLGFRAETVDELVARRKYAKAAEAIRAELARRPKDRRLRLQLADVLVALGKKKEAADVLAALSHDLAGAALAAQAIAVVKRLQALDAGRAAEVEQRLAGDLRPGERPADTAPVPAPPPAAPSPAVRPPDVPADLAPVRSPPSGAARMPLFQGFTRDELRVLIAGLRLIVYEPGEIVVTEGEPGDSLFVVTSGEVRAFIRDRAGRNLEVRRLGEGDFFGEVAVLSGTPRTATITAADRCELLQLDRASLDRILQTHPNVKKVLQEVHDLRHHSAMEEAVRAHGAPGRRRSRPKKGKAASSKKTGSRKIG